ncbi:MAG: hypothetical protein WCP21_20845, partial [Armatimonadota bacterium]
RGAIDYQERGIRDWEHQLETERDPKRIDDLNLALRNMRERLAGDRADWGKIADELSRRGLEPPPPPSH